MEDHSESSKNWTIGGLKYVIAKIYAKGTVERKEGSGRLRSVHTEECIDDVKRMILSQEDQPHKTPNAIAQNYFFHMFHYANLF